MEKYGEEAEFIFIPKSNVVEIAEKTGAIPFDTPGAKLHQRDNRCTFDAIIEDYALADKALYAWCRLDVARSEG